MIDFRTPTGFTLSYIEAGWGLTTGTSLAVNALIYRHHGLRFVHVLSAKEPFDPIPKSLYVLFIWASIYILDVVGCSLRWNDKGFGSWRKGTHGSTKKR